MQREKEQKDIEASPEFQKPGLAGAVAAASLVDDAEGTASRPILQGSAWKTRVNGHRRGWNLPEIPAKARASSQAKPAVLSYV